MFLGLLSLYFLSMVKVHFKKITVVWEIVVCRRVTEMPHDGVSRIRRASAFATVRW